MGPEASSSGSRLGSESEAGALGSAGRSGSLRVLFPKRNPFLTAVVSSRAAILSLCLYMKEQNIRSESADRAQPGALRRPLQQGSRSPPRQYFSGAQTFLQTGTHSQRGPGSWCGGERKSAG